MILGALAITVVCVSLVVRRRRRGCEVGIASVLLTALVRDTSPTTGDWPLAMLGEHEAIADRHERDRFAKGAILALARTRPTLGEPARQFEALVQGACLVAAAALASVCLVRYPGLRVGTPWVLDATLFVLGLTCYAILALTTAKFGKGRVHLVGVLVGLPVLGIGWATGTATSGLSVLLASCVVLVPVLAVSVDLIVARRSATAWVAGMACALTTGLSFFVGFVAASLVTNGGRPTPGLMAEALRSGIHPYSAWAVGDALGGASFMLAYVLVVGGFIGLGVGALVRGHEFSYS